MSDEEEERRRRNELFAALQATGKLTVEESLEIERLKQVAGPLAPSDRASYSWISFKALGR